MARIPNLGPSETEQNARRNVGGHETSTCHAHPFGSSSTPLNHPGSGMSTAEAVDCLLATISLSRTRSLPQLLALVRQTFLYCCGGTLCAGQTRNPSIYTTHNECLHKRRSSAPPASGVHSFYAKNKTILQRQRLSSINLRKCDNSHRRLRRYGRSKFRHQARPSSSGT